MSSGYNCGEDLNQTIDSNDATLSRAPFLYNLVGKKAYVSIDGKRLP